jgi:O-antigen/teichoic acid export membrane protein
LLAVVVLISTIVLTIGGIFLHVQLFELLVGPDYREASYLFPLAVLTSGVFIVGQMISLVPMALGRSRALLAPKLTTAVAAVLLNLAGAYWFGPAGVLWAGLAFSISYCVWVSISAQRLYAARTRGMMSGATLT